MDKVDLSDVLLRVWIRLEEIKNLLAVIEKGLEAEMQTDTNEMHSVICMIKRQMECVIGVIDKNI